MGPISGGTGGSKDLNGHFLYTKFEVHSIILTLLSKNFKIKGFLRYLFQQIFNSTVGPIRMVSHLRGPHVLLSQMDHGGPHWPIKLRCVKPVCVCITPIRSSRFAFKQYAATPVGPT